MSNIVTDLSVYKDWIVRKNVHNTFTITVTQSAVAFNLTNYVFTLNIRKVGSSTNAIQLTQGSGITNGGATGILNIALTSAQTVTLNEQSYYFELQYVNSTLTYGFIHGTLLLRSANTVTATTSLNVNIPLSGSVVNAVITLAGSSSSSNGDVTGPASSVDSNFVAFNSTSGKLIKDSGFSSGSFAPAVSQLRPTTLKIANYSAAAGDYIPIDTTSTAVVITLPTAPADGTIIALKRVAGSVNNVTYNCGGSDVLNVAGGSTSGTLSLGGHQVTLIYRATGAIWYVETSLSLSSLSLTAVIPFHADNGATITQSNQPNGKAFFGNVTRGIIKFDATNYRQIRVVVRMAAGSASANNARFYPGYSTIANMAIGDVTTIGDGTTQSASMNVAANTNSESPWIDLPTLAKADVYFVLCQDGGDGVADPAMFNAALELRN